MSDYLNTVKSCELFAGIPDSELPHLLKCLSAERKLFAKGETVCFAGSQINSAGIVLSGKIHLESNDFLGNTSIVSEFTEGRCYGENYAFALNTRMPFNIVAKENSEILVFNIKKFTEPCIKDCSYHKILMANLVTSIATKSCELSNKISHLSKRTTREKLISYLSEQSQLQKSTLFTLKFNRQELADYLSVERSAMTKELTRMKNDGLIDFDGRVFKLK